jgi:hypothetical protein
VARLLSTPSQEVKQASLAAYFQILKYPPRCLDLVRDSCKSLGSKSPFTKRVCYNAGICKLTPNQKVLVFQEINAKQLVGSTAVEKRAEGLARLVDAEKLFRSRLPRKITPHEAETIKEVCLLVCLCSGWRCLLTPFPCS